MTHEMLKRNFACSCKMVKTQELSSLHKGMDSSLTHPRAGSGTVAWVMDRMLDKMGMVRKTTMGETMENMMHKRA